MADQRDRTPFSKQKAKRILSEKNPKLHGEALSPKQRRLLGFLAGGGKITRRLK